MSFIQNLFTSRDNNANAQTYVGQQGRLWWDPTTNSFYYSDGNTAGGIPIGAGGNPFNQLLNTYNDVTFANVTVTGNLNADLGNISNIANISVIGTANLGNLTITDQTIAGTIDGRDITLSPVGAGTLRTLNGIGVYQGNFSSTPLFSVSTEGVVSTLVPNATSYLGAFEVIGNPAGDSVPPQNYGVMIHTTGVPDTASRIYNDGVDSYGVLVNRRYNGTSAAPTAVLDNQIIGRVGATPYTASGFPSISTARLDFVSTDNQTANTQGTQIQMWTVAKGSNTIVLNAQFDSNGILLTGNVTPTVDSLYSLGNATNRWSNLWLGPYSLNMQDTSTLLNTELTVQDGTLYINGASRIQIGNMQMTTTGISLVTADTGSNIEIGASGDTGYMQLNMPGIKFKDGSIQEVAAIPVTEKGNALGVVPLNASTKIDPIYLPAGGVSFQGIWNASNNYPTLSDGTGTVGYEYIVGTAGTQNLGSGNISFAVGDFVLYTSSNVWVDVPVGGSGVQTFNGRSGIVTLQSGDVTNALSNGSITNSKLVNSNITVNVGDGLSTTGNVIALGGSTTITNTGVRRALAGTGVAVDSATGNVTFSIGQAVGTANSVQFLAVSATTTIQATGNVTGGNLATAGRVVATGNIVTSANVVTPGSIINSSISTSGNIIGANILTAGYVTATGNVTGGNILTSGSVSATGNGSFGNITVVHNSNTANLTVTGITNLNSNANVHISGGIAGQSLATDGAGNLFWTSGTGGNTVIINGSSTSNVSIDFTYNSTTLLYLPTANVNIALANYTAGHTARVIIRYGVTPYPINMGVGNVQQTTEGSITIPISGSGGHKIGGNQSVQLLYTCFDNTAGNCYVASTFL